MSFHGLFKSQSGRNGNELGTTNGSSENAYLKLLNPKVLSKKDKKLEKMNCK